MLNTIQNIQMPKFTALQSKPIAAAPKLTFGNLQQDKFERSGISQSQPAFKGGVKLPIDEVRKNGIELIKKNKETSDPLRAYDNIVKYVQENIKTIGNKIDNIGESSLIKETPANEVERGDFRRDFYHEIHGSYVGDRYQMLAVWDMLDDPELASAFKHLIPQGVPLDSSVIIKKFTNDIVKHTNSTTKLYQKFFDEGLDDATKKVSVRKIFDMVNESLKERKNSKNINVTVENEHLLDSPQGITNMGYKNYIIMSNLIENAIKYSEKDTQIKVKFDLKDDKLHFGVEDQGRGILPEDQSKVVGPERGSNVQDVSGTGYGLYRISSILKFAKLPKLEITSPIHPEEAVKKGTKIETFLLPYEQIQ